MCTYNYIDYQSNLYGGGTAYIKFEAYFSTPGYL